MEGPLVMPNQKHLTLDGRGYIQAGLNSGDFFRRIWEGINKEPTTISKEVRQHPALHNKGQKGGKVLLTILFVHADLLLIFLRERNTFETVIEVFNAFLSIFKKEIIH